MADVLHFTPKAELGANENVLAFVALCRTCSLFCADTQFDKNSWEVNLGLKGKNGVSRLIFSQLEAAQANAKEPAMTEPFLAFAKAVLVYMQSLRPTTGVAFRLSALRLLEAALRQSGKGSRPTAVTLVVLDAAVDLAKRSFQPETAYKLLGQLESIIELMREKRFIALNSRWNSGVRRPATPGSRITPEAIAARESKLPSAAAIRAVGAIFQLADGPVDTPIVSLVALMICAPERINEVLRLKRNCLLEEDAGEFKGTTGIRWPGSKGAADSVKWMPTAMVPVAKMAIKKLLAVSATAQGIAAWYEANPRKVYLHRDAQHLRGREHITYADVGLLLWDDPASVASAKQWCRPSGIVSLPRVNRREAGLVAFADVERAVLAQLPPQFPFTSAAKDLKFSDALCVMRKNELHADRHAYMCLIDIVEQGDVGARLGQRDTSGVPSLFQKYGFLEDDGSPIVVNTHQFRHYLNTLAQLGGMSQTEIAVFSGRKDVGQNVAYDHLTSEQAQKAVSTAIQVHGFTGHLAELQSRSLVERSDFAGLALTAAHTTEYGYCVHNFASEPCQLHQDCINCPEQVCVKGEARKEANLRALRAETQCLLDQALEAMTEEEFGADRWVAHQRKTLARVDQLLTVLESVTTMPGARVALQDVEPSSLIRQDPRTRSIHINPLRQIE